MVTIMNTQINFHNKKFINCDICMKEVPAGDTRFSEIDDYVIYFCGLDCYDKWHKQAKNNSSNTVISC